MRRYPLSDLVAVSRVSYTQIMKRAKLSGVEYARYRDEGMSPIVASRLANVCGYHPCEVWPSWFDDCIEDRGRPCDECGAKFLPSRKDARFCQERCYRRWWAREVARRRRTRPELAERNRRRRRAYYAQNGAYERERERRRYQAQREAS